ncbi:hypothetical protein [Rhizobium sp. RU36D]|uniref:hypothetical protein n=1 Tax=Rhizobium sp. RU36D TaxID=1907415 RepID=UPI0015C49E8D|nr:hypothetical protein [Rhizobium sp. RU36D]
MDFIALYLPVAPLLRGILFPKMKVARIPRFRKFIRQNADIGFSDGSRSLPVE